MKRTENMAHGENTITEAQIAHAEKVQSMWKIVFSQFLEHKAAVVGLCVIVFYIFVALFAPLIQMATGLDPERQNPLQRYQKMYSKTVAGQDERDDLIKKFIENQPEDATQIQTELTAKSLVTSQRPEEALFELGNKDVTDSKEIVKKLDSPGKTKLLKVIDDFETRHYFGTDELGRDVFIRLVYGTRVSMGVGVLVAIASAIIGLLIGAFAGYYGGRMDMILMRITDALLSLPTIPVLIVVAAVDLDKVPGARLLITQQNESIMKLVTILIVFSWMTVARLVRGSVLSLRERDFILAAKTMGATDRTIIFRHLFPNVIAPLLVSVTLGIGGAILYEASLSFLGLGIQPPTPSWGNMLFNAQELITEAPWLCILPGLNILFVVMSFNYLGDGLQDAIDPKAIRR
jgi:peptide/nickel transport system permease protein